jgi:Cell wall-active antibiotics response 4TMS YvqF
VRTAPPPVRHRWDASTVAGLLAVLFGVAWLIGATGILHVSIEAVVAVGLMLLGASLVVTGRTDWSLSRRSWPVWLGIGLIGVLVVTSSAFGLGGALDSVSFGNKTVTAQGGALPTGTVHGGFGNLVVDLTRANTAGSVKVVSVAGNTTVRLPADATVDLDARVVAGQICVNGKEVSSGVGAQDHGDVQPGSPATAPGPTITLHVHQVFGQIFIGTAGCAR